jgi:hypothetical protein
MLRKNIGFVAVGIVWALVLISVYCLPITRFESEGNITTIIAAAASVSIELCAIVVFVGHTGILAGFSTMSASERSKYNMGEISTFMGFLLSVLAIILFPMVVGVGGIAGYATLLVLFLAVTFAGVIWVNVGKRFKAS